MNVESSANETAKTCQPMVCVKTQLSAQLRLKWDDNEGGRAAPVAGEQPPIFQFLLLSPQDQNPKVPKLANFLLSSSSLNFGCWISNGSSVGFLMRVHFQHSDASFFRLCCLSLESQGRCPRTLDPGRGPLPPSWSPVTKPHLESRFFSGQN